MEITIDQLRSRYESLETEDLLLLHAQGGLTQEAELALQTELRARGYADRRRVVEAGTAVQAANAEALQLDTVEQRAARAKFHVIWMVCFFVIPAAVIACMPVFAPFIWRSPADHMCQKVGYWYAKDVFGPTESSIAKVRCRKWRSRWFPIFRQLATGSLLRCQPGLGSTGQPWPNASTSSPSSPGSSSS